MIERIDLVTVDLQLVVETALGIPDGEPDGALRLLTAFQQIGDDAGTETVEGRAPGHAPGLSVPSGWRPPPNCAQYSSTVAWHYRRWQVPALSVLSCLSLSTDYYEVQRYAFLSKPPSFYPPNWLRLQL